MNLKVKKYKEMTIPELKAERKLHAFLTLFGYSVFAIVGALIAFTTRTEPLLAFGFVGCAIATATMFLGQFSRIGIELRLREFEAKLNAGH